MLAAARELAAAAVQRAKRAETALEAERAERHALTDRLVTTAVIPVPTRSRATRPQARAAVAAWIDDYNTRVQAFVVPDDAPLAYERLLAKRGAEAV